MENGCWWHLVKALETQRRIFGRADGVLTEQNLTGGREPSSDVVD